MKWMIRCALLGWATGYCAIFGFFWLIMLDQVLWLACFGAISGAVLSFVPNRKILRLLMSPLWGAEAAGFAVVQLVPGARLEDARMLGIYSALCGSVLGLITVLILRPRTEKKRVDSTPNSP